MVRVAHTRYCICGWRCCSEAQAPGIARWAGGARQAVPQLSPRSLCCQSQSLGRLSSRRVWLDVMSRVGWRAHFCMCFPGVEPWSL